MTMENINVTVLYGSETGTAQDTAEEIWINAKRNGLVCSVMAMDDYNIERLSSERVIIFVASTTGQGDPPSNMRKFWRFLLRKSHPQSLLQNVKYAVLGLGDSSYEKYNFAAKKLNKRLVQLGAQEMIKIALADDQHDLGIDAVIEPWIKKIWTVISNILNIPLKSGPLLNQVIERFNVSIIQPNQLTIERENNITKDIYRDELELNNNLKLATVIDNTRITSSDHFQDVRLIKFTIENVDYQPGDIVYLKPKNSSKQVSDFFNLLRENNCSVTSETLLSISSKEIKPPYCFQRPLTLQQVVEQYWDLNYKPRRSTMQILALISDNKLEKDKLTEFSTAIGQDELYNYVNKPRRNIVEVLRDFPNTIGKLNERNLFEVMAPIKPRAFSIASSSKSTPHEIHLLVAVVKYKTKLMEPRLGLCSNWLASLKKGEKLVCSLQSGTFIFDGTKPMILVGPGTGIAPFRSILLEREATGVNLKDVLLFFGCRNQKKDFHCKQDFERLMKNNNLRFFCAFSRDQEDKIYVQHLIREQGKVCWNLLLNGGKIYLSGNSKNMPKCVRDEFVKIAKKFGNFNDLDAENFVKNLEKCGRYQTETWG
ncbi:NADPH-dependent diflavin oxidoreductase 1 [Fopius arisanus]|uniref:NADPH-dependent diflavin oxidoreductase 1 n=1 Tax=Fopius arisanus TaxID=64838 RepID=A0A9R1TNH2_9HYME|nr:PREDICTED: NADPH-dependent diflavin oxidoreductase 1 [Fopius arisanus]XP_011312375.1 PREDICTED: NADPH-dependent diflavin oxidoreductase 1 [Fopius arisanus]XP_011312376.1 PREDICTED: NADPH-dependent diflavin oxidoreductase 1 [Fopius arisanus]